MFRGEKKLRPCATYLLRYDDDDDDDENDEHDDEHDEHDDDDDHVSTQTPHVSNKQAHQISSLFVQSRESREEKKRKEKRREEKRREEKKRKETNVMSVQRTRRMGADGTPRQAQGSPVQRDTKTTQNEQQDRTCQRND